MTTCFHTALTKSIQWALLPVLSFFVFTAHAQIIWVNSPDTLAGEGTLAVDINADGTDDVLLEILLLPIEALASRAGGMNGTTLLDNSGFGYFDAIGFGEPIEGNFSGATGVLGTFNDAGQFNDGQVHYLGAQIPIAGQNHLAWLALRVTPENDTIFVNSYAWNTFSGGPLSGGQTAALSTTGADQPSILLWPNPADGFVQLEIPGGKPVPYSIYASNGVLASTGHTDGRIDVTQLEQGVYMLRVEMDGRTYAQKLVVK
jgi:hypothetical protein